MTPGSSENTAQLRRLIHTLAEALTAAGSFLLAAREIEDPARQREAMARAQDQINRAGEVVLLLRALVGSDERLSSPPESPSAM